MPGAKALREAMARPKNLLQCQRAEVCSGWSCRSSIPSGGPKGGVWRYRDLLPILENSDHAITLREGNTPLVSAGLRCAKVRRDRTGSPPSIRA